MRAKRVYVYVSAEALRLVLLSPLNIIQGSSDGMWICLYNRYIGMISVLRVNNDFIEEMLYYHIECNFIVYCTITLQILKRESIVDYQKLG